MRTMDYFRLPEGAVQPLAEKFGTPLLVLSLEQIENSYRFLQSCMPRVKIHYAVKANPDANIVKKIAELGGNFDVASNGEINELHAMGIDGSRMLYANPFKTASGLAACKMTGVRRFTLDSEAEIDKIANAMPGAQVLIRVRTDNTDALVDLNKKFGADPKKVLYLIKKAHNAGLDVAGLCFHVGSQSLSSAPYLNALNRVKELFDLAQMEGFHLHILDIGGGYPVPSMSDDIDVAGILSEINAALDRLFPDKELWSEPGRFICATAVNMLTKVIGVTERNNQAWYILDDGVYGVFSGVLFDHWDYELISYKDGVPIPATFAGPSCDSLDVICCDRMTVPLAMDDVLVVPLCGAYSSASATTFNGFAKANTVIWEDVKENFNLDSMCFAPAV